MPSFIIDPKNIFFLSKHEKWFGEMHKMIWQKNICVSVFGGNVWILQYNFICGMFRLGWNLWTVFYHIILFVDQNHWLCFHEKKISINFRNKFQLIIRLQLMRILLSRLDQLQSEYF